MPVDNQLASDTQWLQEALNQAPVDYDLDCFSFLFNTEANAGVGTLPQTDPLHFNASSSVSAAVEIQRLVRLKQAVYNLLQDSESYIESLESALQATQKVGQDLDAVELCLQKADIADQEDSAAEVLPLQAQRVRLPLFPSIYQQIPLLAAQSEEIEQLRLLVCTFPWTSHESVKLKKAVLNQSLRISTLQLASSAFCPEDLLDVVVSLNEEELSKIALPVDRHSKEVIDWIDVADHVGGTHTAEECRTRWLMVERPGVKQDEWSVEERSKLKLVLQEHVSQAKDGIVCDWELVAQQLETGRLGIDCFMYSQQEDLVPAYASSSAQAWSKVPMNDREREISKNLHSIWNDEALVAARLGTNRPREQITHLKKARKPSKKYNWSGRADKALITYVAKECKLKGRSKLFNQLDSLGTIDFSKEYRLRPANVSDRDVEKRWNHIKNEHKKGALSSSATSKAKSRTPNEST